MSGFLRWSATCYWKFQSEATWLPGVLHREGTWANTDVQIQHKHNKDTYNHVTGIGTQVIIYRGGEWSNFTTGKKKIKNSLDEELINGLQDPE
jgi:hypothetical protein